MDFEDRRQNIVKSIPSNYNPYIHASIPSLIGGIIIALAVWQISSPSLLSLTTIPITIFALFGFEWLVHKHVLHQKRRFLEVIYNRHELAHHVIYTDRDMAMRNLQELFLILMPPYAIILVFLFLIPLALVLGLLLSGNVAWMMLATCMVFFLTYEWLHFAYHLPSESKVGRWSVIRKLRAHHQEHHDPLLMKQWNFNVTVPVFDWILKTKF